MAADLGVTRLTVQNAYADLQNSGWVEATVGRGTFVAARSEASRFGSAMAAGLTPDAAIADILQVGQATGLRSFASASPDPTLFPADEFWQGLIDLRPRAAELATYGPSQGVPSLRHELARDLSARGVEVGPDGLMVIAGVSQGLALAAQALAQRGDRVLVEQPTYLGLLHTLKAQGITPIAVRMDSQGIDLDELDRATQRERPRFLYTAPTFQNPTGICMSDARRRAVLDLAAARGLLIVEDDIYGRLGYGGASPLPLKALDAGDGVVYLTSYSKVLMPGLRLGCLVAPRRILERLLSLRRAADLCSPPLLQHALAGFLHNGGLKRHLRRVLPVYSSRRDALTAALQRYLPREVQWTDPRGGFCCWLTLPGRQEFADLERTLLQQGIAVTPGEVFMAESAAGKSLRFCFGSQPPDTIRHGVEALSREIRACMERDPLIRHGVGDWAPLV
jgi:DNA-binding transcriptional MocR family regulator